MKKLFSSPLLFLLPAIPILIFFIFNILSGRFPIPADVILGLYHPWRDESYNGYDPERFPTKNPLITDPVLQTYPWRKLTIENFKSRSLPLWNPYSFSGQPLLANIQSAPFSIFNIIFFMLPFNVAWITAIIITPVLASLFMYLFLKSYNLSKFACIFASAIWPFCGFFIAWMTWGTVTSTAIWLPLILLSTRKLARRQNSTKWFLICVFSVSQTFFAGHLQTGFYVISASLLFIIYEAASRRNFKIIALLLSPVVFGVMVASVQLLPSLEFIKYSARQIDQNYYPTRQDWFLPPEHLIQILAPDFFGNPATYNYWGIWNWAEFSSSVSLFAIVLALFALLRAGAQAKFFKILLVISIVLLLENPLSKIPYTNNWPLIASTQPSRILFLMTFALVVLGGFGLDKFLRNKDKKRRHFLFVISLSITSLLIIIAGVSILAGTSFWQKEGINSQAVAQRNLILPIVISLLITLVAIFHRLKINKKILIAALVFVTFFELYRTAQKITPFSKLPLIFPQTHVTDFLSNQQRPFRIMTTDRRIFNGNTPSVYSLESVSGYDPLYLKDYAQLVSSWEASKLSEPGSFNRIISPTNYKSQIANLLNIKYVISFDEINDASFQKVFEYGQTKIFENRNVLPRAFFVQQIKRVNTRDEELKKIIEGPVDLKTTATSSEFEYKNDNQQSSVQVLDYKDQYVTFDTIASSEAPLVVSNIYYPGWEATIDGQPTQVKRVNFMFQSVLVPQGEHQVKFKYKPQSFYNGAYLSVTGILLSAISAFLLWRRKFL